MVVMIQVLRKTIGHPKERYNYVVDRLSAFNKATSIPLHHVAMHGNDAVPLLRVSAPVIGFARPDS